MKKYMQFAFKAVYLSAGEIVPPDTVYTAEENYKILLLSESIKQTGLLFPLYLKLEKTPPYRIICGRKRYKAAVLSGLEKIPCILCRVSDAKALLMSSFCESENEETVKKLYELGYSEEYISTAMCKSSSEIFFKEKEDKPETKENPTEKIINITKKPKFPEIKINDGRFLVNTVRKAVDSMADSEFRPKFTQRETENFTEIKIRIPKKPTGDCRMSVL